MVKDVLDSVLLRVPSLYLLVERHRRWLNWDRRIYLALVRHGDVIFDVGANVGAHSIALARLAGTEGRVLAYEPVPSNFAALQDNLRRRAPGSNVTAHRGAVGNPKQPGLRSVIHVPGDDGTQASLQRHSHGSWVDAMPVQSFECPITSVDAEAAKLRLSRLDFLKLDVEGGELDVIRGAADALERFQPFIYCEVYESWTSAFGYTPAELVREVALRGYATARVIRNGLLRTTDVAELARERFDVSTNVLFVPPRRAGELQRFDRMFLKP